VPPVKQLEIDINMPSFKRAPDIITLSDSPTESSRPLRGNSKTNDERTVNGSQTGTGIFSGYFKAF